MPVLTAARSTTWRKNETNPAWFLQLKQDLHNRLITGLDHTTVQTLKDLEL